MCLQVRLETAIQNLFLYQVFPIAVFLDFKKAYDMLSTKGMLYKFEPIGIKGNKFGSICSFLGDRTCACINVYLGYSLHWTEHHRVVL